MQLDSITWWRASYLSINLLSQSQDILTSLILDYQIKAYWKKLFLLRNNWSRSLYGAEICYAKLLTNEWSRLSLYTNI